MVGQLANVDPKIADRVAKGLGVAEVKPVQTSVKARADLKPSPALSILGKAKKTLEGRKVGCLIADGTDAKLVNSLRAAVKKQNADFAVVAPKVSGASGIEADFQLAGGSSVLFDAVFVAISDEGAKMLLNEAAAVAWVHDAFAHCKVIGATKGARPLLEAAGVIEDVGVLVDTSPKDFVVKAAEGRVWEREPKVRTVY